MYLFLPDQVYVAAFRASAKLSAWCPAGFVTSKWVVGLVAIGLSASAHLLAALLNADGPWGHTLICGLFFLADRATLRWAYKEGKEDQEDTPSGVVSVQEQYAFHLGCLYLGLMLLWACLGFLSVLVAMRGYPLAWNLPRVCWHGGLLVTSAALRAFGMYAFVAPGGFGVHAAAPIEA